MDRDSYPMNMDNYCPGLRPEEASSLDGSCRGLGNSPVDFLDKKGK